MVSTIIFHSKWRAASSKENRFNQNNAFGSLENALGGLQRRADDVADEGRLQSFDDVLIVLLQAMKEISKVAAAILKGT